MSLSFSLKTGLPSQTMWVENLSIWITASCWNKNLTESHNPHFYIKELKNGLDSKITFSVFIELIEKYVLPILLFFPLSSLLV